MVKIIYKISRSQCLINNGITVYLINLGKQAEDYSFKLEILSIDIQADKQTAVVSYTTEESYAAGRQITTSSATGKDQVKISDNTILITQTGSTASL